MSQGFLGLNIALSGLFASQRKLGIVAHNVANAHTEGYSRQMMQTKAFPSTILTGGFGTLGTGVNVNPVKQIRDEYLDYKFRSETSIQQEWKARDSVLKEIEGIFNEPSDTSISELLNKFYESIRTFQDNTENLTARTLVRQNIIAVSEGSRRLSNMLKNIQKDLNFQFNSAVKDINGLAEKITEMNKAIHKVEIEGGKANDLRDQRNLLVDKLSKYVKVDYYEDSLNRFYVLVGGQQLVAHYRTDGFQLIPREHKLNEDDDSGIYDIKWQNGNEINLATGKLKGLMDIRDNIAGNYKGVPHYVDRLNDFVTTFIQELNNVHAGGYGLDKSTGNMMFTIKGFSSKEFKDYIVNRGLNGGKSIEVTEAVLNGVSALPDDQQSSKIRENIAGIIKNNPSFKNKAVYKLGEKYYVIDKIRASELSIASDLNDLNKLAAAEKVEDLPGDGKNMLKILATRHNKEMYAWGAPEDFLKSLVSNLGVDAQDAKRVHTNQNMLVKEYSQNRDSIMGVSMDEEISNMMKYQTAYSANARMVNVFDEMLDLLVNRLGHVGR